MDHFFQVGFIKQIFRGQTKTTIRRGKEERMGRKESRKQDSGLVSSS